MANFRWNFVAIFSLGKIQKFWIGKFPIESGKCLMIHAFVYIELPQPDGQTDLCVFVYQQDKSKSVDKF